MIIQTTKEINGVMYNYTYSDSNYMIERDGARYSEAIDPLDSGRVYTETDEPIGITDGAMTGDLNTYAWLIENSNFNPTE